MNPLLASGIGCLNNRYHDPTTNQFISVDPLVTTTGQPYIYGSANPVTYSDPSGLCSPDPKQREQCEQETIGNDPTSGTPVTPLAWYFRALNNCAGGLVVDCGKDHTDFGLGLPDAGRTMPPMPPIVEAPRLWAEVLGGLGSLSDPDGYGTGLGGCLDVGGSAGASGGGSSCLIIDLDGVSTTTTAAYGVTVGVPAFSGSAGPVVSNTDAKLLAGHGICGNVSGGGGFGGAGALCGGISYEDDAWAATGGWSFYLGASVTTPSAEVGYAYTYTWVDRMIWWPW